MSFCRCPVRKYGVSRGENQYATTFRRHLSDIRGNREQDGYAEYATPNYIAGGFADKDKERFF